MVSMKEHARHKRRIRRVVRTGDLSREDVSLIAAAEVPSEHASLDVELTATTERETS
jgi:hypothetical protein